MCFYLSMYLKNRTRQSRKDTASFCSHSSLWSECLPFGSVPPLHNQYHRVLMAFWPSLLYWSTSWAWWIIFTRRETHILPLKCHFVATWTKLAAMLELKELHGAVAKQSCLEILRSPPQTSSYIWRKQWLLVWVSVCLESSKLWTIFSFKCLPKVQMNFRGPAFFVC